MDLSEIVGTKLTSRVFLEVPSQVNKGPSDKRPHLRGLTGVGSRERKTIILWVNVVKTDLFA